MKPDTLTRAGWPSLAFSRFVLRAVCSAFFITLFISPSFASAQEATCGDIVAPRYFLEYASTDQTIDRERISDCADPFGETTNPPSPYSLMVDGNEVISGGVATVAVGGTRDFSIDGHAYGTTIERLLFKHEGGDYVYLDINSPEITDQQVIDYGAIYFTGSPDRALYQEVIAVYFGSGHTNEYFYDENGDEILDSTGTSVIGQFYTFLDSAETTLLVPPQLVRAGTYTMVIEENLLILSQRTWQQQLRDLFIKTAHAQQFFPPNIYTITFTIVEGEAVIGPASVLFLPGIMGSRLFEESDVCNFFGGVDKVERWFSSLDCDMERLMMNENGESINNIFTEVEGGIIEDVGIVSNPYDSLFEDLEEWKEDEKIADYRGVPYDWRLRLDDILKTVNVGGRISLDSGVTYQDGYVYRSLVALRDASPSGKVVLVGHSNGGLVIQALLAEMKANNDPLLAAVEKVVLVAVPQAGAPESILGLLHGVEVGEGLIVSKEKSRKLMNAAPFAYHLLPTEGYYDMVETPVIRFESGTSTDAWIAQFGNDLDTVEEVENFMKKESGRAMPAWDDTETPATTYSGLHEYAQSVHNYLNDWRPNTTTVYEVAGVGVLSPATVTYFTDTKCIKTKIHIGGGEECIENGPVLGHRISDVIDGDGTVLAPSSLANQSGEGVNKWWLDLKRYNELKFETIHKNVMEVEGVRNLIAALTEAHALGSYNYLGTIMPDLGIENRLVYQLHSPLDMYVVLSDGEVVGSSTPMLRGVMYRRYGEVQHLSIPEEETGYEVRLAGIATGSFTLDIEQYEGNSLDERVTYSALPSSTSTKVTIEVSEEEALGEIDLQIDYEGDGVFETVALPGLGQVTFMDTTPVDTSTPTVVTKGGSTGTKVKARGLAIAQAGALSAATVYTTEQDMMLKLIQLLTQYRDLLVKLKVQ